MPNQRREVQARRSASARQRMTGFLEDSDYPAVVLTTPAAVAWATGGVAPAVDRSAASDGVWVVVNPTFSVLVTSEVEADRVLDEYEPKTHGFDLVVVPWFEPLAPIEAALQITGVAAARLASDGHPGFGFDVADDLTALRLALCDVEQDELTALGASAASALGNALQSWRPGIDRDLDVQANLVAMLESEGVDTPVVIVGGDERVRRFRHPMAIGATMHEQVMAVVVAHRDGLHVAATRFALTDPPTATDSALRRRVDSVEDAVLGASVIGATYGDALSALESAYDAISAPGAWREHYQGGPIGFRQREFEIAPSDRASRWYNEKIASGHALAWNPSLAGGAKVEDTFLVSAQGLTRITNDPEWPVASTPMDGRTRPVPLIIGK